LHAFWLHAFWLPFPLASIAVGLPSAGLWAAVGLPFPLAFASVLRATASRWAACLLPACLLPAACVRALRACVAVRRAVRRACSPFVLFFRAVVSNRPLQGLQGAMKNRVFSFRSFRRLFSVRTFVRTFCESRKG